jgi:hypothetical protein
MLVGARAIVRRHVKPLPLSAMASSAAQVKADADVVFGDAVRPTRLQRYVRRRNFRGRANATIESAT